MAKLDQLAEKANNSIFNFLGSTEMWDHNSTRAAMDEEGISSVVRNYSTKKGEPTYVVRKEGESKKPIKLTSDEFKEQFPKCASSFEVIKVAAIAGDDNIIDAVRSLTEPTTSREGMSELYNNLLGYDPTSYFDECDIAAQVKAFQADNYDDGTADTIIDKAVTIHEENRGFNISQAIKSAMRDCEEVSSATIQEFEEQYITPFITEDDDTTLNLDDIEDDVEELEDDIDSESDDDDDYDGDDDE